jgi:hypothetical protein
MKYNEALQKRKLEVENLSKGIQKKIEELHYLNDAYNNLDSEGVEDEESKKNLEEIEEKISSLDESIADFIYAFDAEKYQKQLESMAKTRAKRKNVGGEAPVAVAPIVTTSPVAPVVTTIVAPVVTTPVAPVETIAVAPVVTEKVPEVVAQKPEPVQERGVESVYDKLEDLKKSVHIDTANFKTRQRVEEEEQDIEVQEEEEFEKHSDTTPKKMSTGLILMGVGAFFLTWGAVNFFKSRR